jgi:adenylate kinase
MQQSFNKVLKLVASGDFMLEQAEEKILNKNLDDY